MLDTLVNSGMKGDTVNITETVLSAAASTQLHSEIGPPNMAGRERQGEKHRTRNAEVLVHCCSLSLTLSFLICVFCPCLSASLCLVSVSVPAMVFVHCHLSLFSLILPFQFPICRCVLVCVFLCFSPLFLSMLLSVTVSA